MSSDLVSFEDYSDEEEGVMWRLKASTRALFDIVEKYNLEEEVEALYEIYVAEEKAVWEKWAREITEES